MRKGEGLPGRPGREDPEGKNGKKKRKGRENMTKNEFLRELRAIPGHETEDITAQLYALVERVYTWHPCIPNVGGKRVIAQLYAIGGEVLIMDMLPRADAAIKAAEDSIRAIRRDIVGAENYHRYFYD
jgi:hypothetical protein